MKWGDLNDSTNGMKEVLIIIALEWIIFLPIAYYIDQASSIGNRVKSPFSLLNLFRKKMPMPSVLRKSSLSRNGQKVFVEMEKADVVQEVRQKLSSLFLLFS